jgi:hypothetical protein
MWANGIHKGVDFLCPSGTDVVAPWSGTVVEVGHTSWGSAFGTAVLIDFDRLPDGSPGLWGVLAHLSAATVKAGSRVAAGARVGRSGATGNVSGPHLHFEVQRDRRWRSDNHTDPAPWLDAANERSAPVSRWRQDPVKPSGTLRITSGSGYRTVDVPDIVPGCDDMVIHELYLNVTYTLKVPGQAAKLRVKMVREPFHGKGEDPTFYQGYWLLPGFDNFLITRVGYELAERGRHCHWEVRVDGADVTIGTRFSKATQI